MRQANQRVVAIGRAAEHRSAGQWPRTFLYDSSDDSKVAQTIHVDESVSPAQLAPVDSGPPAVANGIPLALAALASPQQAIDQIGGGGLHGGFFEVDVAAQYGKSPGTMRRAKRQARQSSSAQAKDLREQQNVEDVRWTEEAATLFSFKGKEGMKLTADNTVFCHLPRDLINIATGFEVWTCCIEISMDLRNFF